MGSAVMATIAPVYYYRKDILLEIRAVTTDFKGAAPAAGGISRH